MQRSLHPRNSRSGCFRQSLCAAAFGLPLLTVCAYAPSAFAQDASSTPASIPAGVSSAKVQSVAIRPAVSAKDAREAEDAYLAGAKEVVRKNLEAAEQDFGRALKLNPGNPDYEMALAVTRQQRVTELVQKAARARLSGDNIHSTELLAQAHQLDPDSDIVNQHLGPDAEKALRNTPVNASLLPADEIASTLAGPVELKIKPVVQSFHRRGSAQDMVRAVYSAYGLKVVFDPSVTSNSSIRLDIDDVNYNTATRVIDDMAHVFAVAVQPDTVLIAHDSPEDRDRLTPLVEETIYLPGVPAEEMTELASLARSVFDLKKVTASASGGDILLQGDESTLKLLNATYDDMLDGGSDVLLDIRLYEISTTHMVDIGAQIPGSANLFPLASTAENLITANQSLIQQAVASGLITLTGNPSVDIPAELELLIGANVTGASQFTDLLLVLGHLDSLPFAGLALSSTSTFNLLLNSSDVRALDAVTLRSGNHQESTFRAGTRYPIVTATYSSGVTGALASQLSGLSSSAAALAQQYLGSSSVNIPQFQYEDLGITLKATPQIKHNGGVSLKLDMKIEALGGGTINSIPILNNRTLTSTIDVPSGQTAMLASLVDANEMKSIEGLPGLSELPGFQGTDQDTQKSSDELLITITPHIVRSGALHIASRRLSFPRVGASAQ